MLYDIRSAENLKKKIVGIFFCTMLLIPAFSLSATADPEAKLDIQIYGGFPLPILIRNAGGVIVNVGDATAYNISFTLSIIGGTSGNINITHEGYHEYLEPLNMTQQQLADALGITRVRINEIILGKRKITPDTAFRLAKYFKTTAEFWINMQNNLDMWETLQNHKIEYDKIHPLAS